MLDWVSRYDSDVGNSQCKWQVEQGVHVLHCGCACCQTGAAKETLKESENEEASEVIDQRRREGEDGEESHGRGIDWRAPDNGDLRQRRPEKRAQTICKNVE